MSTQIAVPVPTDVFLGLAQFLREQRSHLDPVDAVAEAIYYWMDNASWKPELLPATSPSSRGYTWRYKDKSLFLPDNTEIRMRYRDQYHYAKVDRDQIMFDGVSVSPSVLANRITGSNRNAWRDLWIKRPTDKEWKLADDLRKEIEKLLRELDEIK
jgi:hypothetical protein